MATVLVNKQFLTESKLVHELLFDVIISGINLLL